jgi:hypothetical protein
MWCARPGDFGLVNTVQRSRSAVESNHRNKKAESFNESVKGIQAKTTPAESGIDDSGGLGTKPTLFTPSSSVHNLQRLVDFLIEL